MNSSTSSSTASPTTARAVRNPSASRPPRRRIGLRAVFCPPPMPWLVGGSSTHYTANFWRFHEIDFNERSVLGAIPGTGFADWPITYQDLEPYYTKVEWEVGVSGLANASPFDPPRSKPYPMPPLPVKSSGVLLERGARKLGLHPFPAPMAIASVAYRGRGPCVHCGFCMGFGCEARAKSSTFIQHDSGGRGHRAVRGAPGQLCVSRRHQCPGPHHRRALLRLEETAAFSAGAGGGVVRQWRRDDAAAAQLPPALASRTVWPTPAAWSAST